jgi:hypothetical protein
MPAPYRGVRIESSSAEGKPVVGEVGEMVIARRCRRCKAKAESGASTAQEKAQSWWDDTRSTIDARLASLRAERDEHKAERDLKKAERRADEAEQDAADAVTFAVAMLDQAEYAIADAVIARADADDLAKNQAG